MYKTENLRDPVISFFNQIKNMSLSKGNNFLQKIINTRGKIERLEAVNNRGKSKNSVKCRKIFIAVLKIHSNLNKSYFTIHHTSLFSIFDL